MDAGIRAPEGAAAEAACWIAAPTPRATPKRGRGAAEKLLKHQQLGGRSEKRETIDPTSSPGTCVAGSRPRTRSCASTQPRSHCGQWHSKPPCALGQRGRSGQRACLPTAYCLQGEGLGRAGAAQRASGSFDCCSAQVCTSPAKGTQVPAVQENAPRGSPAPAHA